MNHFELKKTPLCQHLRDYRSLHRYKNIKLLRQQWVPFALFAGYKIEGEHKNTPSFQVVIKSKLTGILL